MNINLRLNIFHSETKKHVKIKFYDKIKKLKIYISIQTRFLTKAENNSTIIILNHKIGSFIIISKSSLNVPWYLVKISFANICQYLTEAFKLQLHFPNKPR